MAATKKKKSRAWRVWIVITILLLIAIYKIFAPNTGKFTQGQYLYVHTGAGYEQVKAAAEQGGFVADMVSFDLLAKALGLPAHIHAGKYKINEGMGNYGIIRLLRSGRQTQVNLVI